MKFEQLKKDILAIDSRFSVKRAVWLDDAEREYPAAEVSIPHFVHGKLSTIEPLTMGWSLILWAKQKQPILDQTRVDQIQELADSLGWSYERVESQL